MADENGAHRYFIVLECHTLLLWKAFLPLAKASHSQMLGLRVFPTKPGSQTFPVMLLSLVFEASTELQCLS